MSILKKISIYLSIYLSMSVSLSLSLSLYIYIYIYIYEEMRLDFIYLFVAPSIFIVKTHKLNICVCRHIFYIITNLN